MCVVNKYKNIYHSTIKMKPVDVRLRTYIHFHIENNKDPKFEVGNHVRTSKYKKVFAKGHVLNWSEEIFLVKKVNYNVPRTYVISDINGEEILGKFYERELRKSNRKEYRVEKVIKKKGDKLYVRWKGCHNSFNS